jgi:hypothetical protein
MSDIILYSICVALIIYLIYLIYVISDKGDNTKEDNLELIDNHKFYFNDNDSFEKLKKVFRIIEENESEINGILCEKSKQKTSEEIIHKIKKQINLENLHLSLEDEDILFIIKLYGIFRSK